MKRLFILRERCHYDNMVAAIGANWAAMAATGVPLGIHVAPYRKTRSDEANSLMWAWLGQIAQDAWVGGRQYSAEVWHLHAKREYLPEVNARGDEKWRVLPDGSRECVGSTTRLNTAEMRDYMDKLGAMAAGLGVELR